MSNPNTSSSDEDDEQSPSNNVRQKYTQEQKIVSAVWVHEKSYNGQSFDDIKSNFRIRFKMHPPKSRTFSSWERRLFTEGLFSFAKDRTRRPYSERLMHVPYVKASFKEKPNLTLRERANQLGLTPICLRNIIKYDLKESDIKPQTKENTWGENVESEQDDVSKSDNS